MSELRDRVDFSRIRYANCWEDAAILLQATNILPDDRVLIIASAGDNALALLSRGPQAVHAVDLSIPQLHLCRLKQAAFSALEYDELLTLVGVSGNAVEKRWLLYQMLRGRLDPEARDYWDVRRVQIEQGLIHQGKFEHYFSLFRKWLLPLVHGRHAIRQLLATKNDEAQAAFFSRHWNSWRWRLLMQAFFSKPVMGRYGRDPQFLKHVALNVASYIRAKSERHLQSSAATRNPFLEYIFTGNFIANLPVYLREEYFQAIRQNIGRLQLSACDMSTAVSAGTYSVYCASNIFEYMSAETFNEVTHSWSLKIAPGARLAYWNLMAPRSFAENLPDTWTGIVSNPSDIDMGFFYSRFICELRT